MLKSSKAVAILAAAAFSAIGAHSASATTITDWNFSGATVGTVTSSPTPSAGTGTATSLGMTNTYTYAGGEGPDSVDGSNITNVSSTADSSFSENTWRIVGNSNSKNAGSGMANGWNNSAPNYTQGAEFAVSTAGYTNIGLSFDWFSTSKGVGNLQVRYTLDDTQGASTVWTNLGSDFVATSNDFYGATATSVTQPNISLDLSSIAGANNDANFAVELVSVKPVSTDSNFATVTTPGDYASAGGGNYNNSSGNWSFDNVAITGTSAVPEPGSLSLLGLAGIALLNRRRGKKA